MTIRTGARHLAGVNCIPATAKQHPMHPPIALRIGHHKCGTTFIQNSFFRHHPDLAHLGKPWVGAFTDRQHPIRAMLRQISGAEPYDAERCRAMFDRTIAPHIGGKLVTISHGDIAKYHGPASLRTAERLREIFGPARIIFSVRRQLDFVKSMHGQSYSIEKTKLSIDDWIDANWGAGRHLQELIRYDRIAQSFADAFGAENVFVHLAEDLRANPARFVESVSAFLGLDPKRAPMLSEAPAQNVRAPAIKMSLLRYPRLYSGLVRLKRALPAALQQRLLSMARARSYEPRLGARWVERIEAIAREVNPVLAQRFGLPVGDYGYTLPDARLRRGELDFKERALT